MNEHIEQITGEQREQLTDHMITMDFGLQAHGVDLAGLVGIGPALNDLQEAFGEQLGLTSVGAHIDVPDHVLRVVAHVNGFESDAEGVVGYVARVAETFGIEEKLGLPAYRVQTTSFEQAS